MVWPQLKGIFYKPNQENYINYKESYKGYSKMRRIFTFVNASRFKAQTSTPHFMTALQKC